MATSVPAIVWPLNFALVSGNPLCQGTANIAPLDSAQLIQGDQRVQQLYFLLPGGQEGSTPGVAQLPSGAGVIVTGKLADDLEAATVLFRATGFAELQNAANQYFYQAFLDLDKQEIVNAFSVAGDEQNTLLCLVDVVVTVPAVAASAGVPAVPASRATYQLSVTLKRQVSDNSESAPTPATPTYPPPAAIAVIAAQAAAAIPGVSVSALTGGAGTLDHVAIAALPTYQVLLVSVLGGTLGFWRVEPDTDALNGAVSITTLDHDPVTNPRSLRQRL